MIDYEINGDGSTSQFPCKNADLAFECAEDTCHQIAMEHYEGQDADDRARIISTGTIEIKLMHEGDERTCEVTVEMEPCFVAFEI